MAAGVVPGLERAIPKNSGIEFGSLLHQLGADFAASPYSPAYHAILLEIEPKAKERLPSRRAKRVIQETAGAPADSDESKGKKAAAEATAAHGKSGKPARETKKETPEPKKDSGRETTAAVKEPSKEPAREPPVEPKKKATPPKKKPAAEAAVPDSEPPTPTETSRKKGSEKIEAETLQAGKKKQAPPSKKALPKKKPEEGKGRGQADQGSEAAGLDAIAKRKPR
jgi:hypothetical protein